MKKILSAAILILAAGTGWFFLRQEPLPQTVLTLYGNVDIRQVDISFKVSGLLQNMYFEEGNQVKKGDLLASLDDRDYRENYQKSLSEIKRYEAKMKEAASVLETHRPLCAKNITSQRDCISYTNARDEAAAAYESAVINSQYEKNLLDDTKVYAPSDGVVSTRIQEPGAMLQAGQLIYTITKTEPVWIRTYIPEIHLGNIAYGTEAVVITDSADPQTGRKREYAARVGYISPVAEFTPKTVQTEDLRTDLVYRLNIYLDNPDRFVRQGMPVTVKIDLNRQERADDGNNLH